MKKYCCLLFLFITVFLVACQSQKVDFAIEDGSFVLDGKPTQLICGEMHYPRIPHEYWRDRMKRAKAMGINTISTYVFWNYHERQPGDFEFEGQADIARFVRTAQEEGLYVILRPGPYVCAEWDFGGYPFWLQKNKEMIYRSNDEAFLAACERYIDRLGKELAPLTVTNGGNILMVQVENEYGSFGKDQIYLEKVRHMIINAGFNVPLVTCDGIGQIESGHLKGTLAAVNGVIGKDIIKHLDKYQPGGPYFIAEFYPGWFDAWGIPRFRRDDKKLTEKLDWILKNKMSVSLYLFHGGTNFAYTNGANATFGYVPQTTSYDYDAPLGEYGNATPKYYAFRETIQKYLPEGKVLPDVPAENPVISFPMITLEESAPLSSAFTKRIVSDRPLTMEALDQDFGYIHYETVIDNPVKGVMQLKDLRDYAVVLVNGVQIGSIDRRLRQNRIEIDIKEAPARLEILVENVGRVNYGIDIQNNLKGITEKVLLNGEEINGWTVSPLPLYKADVTNFEWKKGTIDKQPCFFRGSFRLSTLGDCFVDTRGWGKGAVWVNGHSLGKFWNIGPQQTLYLPAPWLKEGDNEIVVFEMEDTGQRTIQGLDKPILDEVGEDKNVSSSSDIEANRIPILDVADRIFTGKLEKIDSWQTFALNNAVSARYLCIEVLTSYDDINSCISEINLIGSNGRALPKDDWKIVYSTTEQIGEGEADHLIDGNANTYWHSQWQETTLPFPHRIIIDLDESQTIKGIELKQRHPEMPGCVKDFCIYGRSQAFMFRDQ